ncbi:MAG: phosphatidylserine decarboxylase, partial [Pseudomonadota bacterium]|nr:phosphatidylserine decarboxylase [Pseudomonadota bacterium]
MPKPDQHAIMSADRYPLLAREGWGIVAVSALVALAATWAFGGWSLIAWVWLAFTLQFFRDPPRKITTEPGAVAAPASGRVVAISHVEDPYLKRPALKISVFMNVFSVHSNLAPITGTVRERWYHPGKFLNAALDKASSENERNALWIRTGRGADVTCVQIAGLIARRILCYAETGDSLRIGERYGFIRFGSRVDLYLPPDSEVRTAMGARVTSGNSVVAALVKD